MMTEEILEVFREQVLTWPQRLDKHKCTRIMIRSDKDNHPMYIAGKGKWLADIVKGWPLYGGDTMTFTVKNSGDISVVGTKPGEYIDYIIFI